MKEIRIFGPPGTGKTTTLSGLVFEEYRKHGFAEMIVASFTRAAAQELILRIGPDDDQRIGTLHALCYRHLGYPKLVEDEKKGYLTEWNQRHPRLAVPLQGPVHSLDAPYDLDFQATRPDVFFDYHRYRARMVPREAWSSRVITFAEKWEEFKRQTDTVDFTDLIELCLLDKTPPMIAKVGFFDEVQDFSPLELALVRKWSREMERCYLAGDDDQCIYAFKGSTPNAFLYPPLPQEQKIILTQSHRLPRRIHQKALRWVESISPREPKGYAPRDAEGVVTSCEFSYKHPEFFLRRLEADMRDYKTVMILGSCVYMVVPLMQVLRKRGIPFHNPYRKDYRPWNPLRNQAERIGAFLIPQPRDRGGREGCWTYETWWLWAEMLLAKPFILFTKKEMEIFAKDTNKKPQLVSPGDLERWIDGDEHFEAILHGDLDWLKRMTKPRWRKQLDFPLRVIEKYGIRTLVEPPKLIIGTIHSVKGGEAEAVWLFPDVSPQAERQRWGSLDGKMAIKRVMYVGMTRAKEKLVLCQPASSRHAWN